jgi:rhamnogalacturonyl hydrolase YesR
VLARKQWFILLLFGAISAAAQERAPEELARLVADHLVSMTDFRFVASEQRALQDGSYAVDFYEACGSRPGAHYVARGTILFDSSSSAGHRVLFAFTHSAGEVEIRLNGETIYNETSNQDGQFRYADYGLFSYAQYRTLLLQKRENSLVVRFRPSGSNGKLYFGLLRPENGLAHPGTRMRALPGNEKFNDYPLLLLGPLATVPPSVWNPEEEHEILNESYRSIDGKAVRWDLPRTHLVRELVGELALQDWRYFTGTFLDALLEVSKHFQHLDYRSFVDRHTRFFLDHRESVKEERELYSLRESPFGHYFRFSLLDDMGMQAVPFLELLREKGGRNALVDEEAKIRRELVDRVVYYILEKSTRLNDGTFARYTPDTMTVWADDLFMGSVILTRYATAAGDDRTLEEAVRQVILFDRHLRDAQSNLYWHGWFSRTGKPSSSKWARANGWALMAKLEVLLALSGNHPRRSKVLNIFRRHARGLLAVQSDDGRWHQVLDNPSTYLETSATAMFLRCFAVGVMKGWLDKGMYDEAIRKAWEGVVRQVRADGSVEGIVRGTPIMYSDTEYGNHPPRLNDPRGLGAVLYAIVAWDRYRQTFRIRD